MRWLAAPLVLTGVLTSAASAVPLKQFNEQALGFEISMPQGCRHTSSPGTIEAVCAPSLDAAAAKHMPAAGAWLFEIDFEEAPTDAPSYSMEAFKGEIPGMICGAGDATGVRISEPREVADGKRRIFEASVTCPALSFLSLPERTARARVVISGQKRFRLMARTPSADALKAEDATKAFLASFKLAD
jgi:hypothetical protein